MAKDQRANGAIGEKAELRRVSQKGHDPFDCRPEEIFVVDQSLKDLIGLLRSHAGRLEKISRPSPSATAFYEVMSGGLVWTDEKIQDVPTEVIWALRPLWAYRSSVICGVPAEKWRPYWDICLSLFPHWIGFLPERMKPSPELLEILKSGREGLMRDLAAAEE